MDSETARFTTSKKIETDSSLDWKRLQEDAKLAGEMLYMSLLKDVIREALRSELRILEIQRDPLFQRIMHELERS